MAEKTDFERITDQIKDLQTEAGEIATKLEGKSLSGEDMESLKGDMGTIVERLGSLEADRKTAEVEFERKALVGRLEDLTGRFDAAGKAMPDFFPTAPAAGDEDAVYGDTGEHSYFNDVRLGKEGDQDARKRIAGAFEGKAMGEGVDSSGGFMVIPEVSNELITIRDHVSVLRGLFTSQSIQVDTIRFISQDSGLAVAWTAEFAEKIRTDFAFSEFEAHVFTAAGLAVASNQLLADSKWDVDRMVSTDMAKRFISLEEQAFLSGTGVGQPLGIINTPGVQSIPYTGTASQQNLLDKISDAITNVYTNFLGAPNAIVMHPRTWGYIVKGREATAPSTYLIGAGSTAFGRRGNDPLPGYGSAALPRGELFGLPVYCTPNVPTNLGDNKDESAVFVGDWSQGLVLDRQGITTDVSSHVYFTSNQTVFRSEERLGFTAARYPAAFAVVQGDALAGV
jgi:HK97 family phage major capsid protein